MMIHELEIFSKNFDYKESFEEILIYLKILIKIKKP